MAAYRILNLEILSADALSSTLKRPYVVASICDRKKKLIFPKEKSKVGKDSGSGLRFKFQAMFYINVALAQDNGLNLVVKLMSKRWAHSNDEIGVVSVPITELLKGLDGGTEDHEKQETSESIVNPEGTEEGTLKFSYKFGRILREPPKELKKKFRTQKFKEAANKLIKKCAIKVGIAAVMALFTEMFQESGLHDLQESVLHKLSVTEDPSAGDDDGEEDE